MKRFGKQPSKLSNRWASLKAKDAAAHLLAFRAFLTRKLVQGADDVRTRFTNRSDVRLPCDTAWNGTITGCVNGLFADGSVRTIADAVNADTFRALGTRAG